MTMTVFTAVEACWFAKLLFDLFGTAILTLFGSLSLDQATCCLFARYLGFDIIIGKPPPRSCFDPLS